MITPLDPNGPGSTSHDSSGSGYLFAGGSTVGPLTLYAKTAGGNWSSPSTWSLTSSSGSDNSGPPDATQPFDVIFDSGSGNVTIDVMASCRSINCTGYTGTLTHNSGFNLAVGHTSAPPLNIALKLSSGMTYTPISSTSMIVMSSTVVTQVSLFSSGKTIGGLTVSGLTGSYILGDALTITNFLILSAGTFDTNGNTITAQGIAFSGSTVNLGASQINLTRTSTGNVVTTSAGTINAGTSEFAIVNASSNTRTFAGGGKTYYNLTYIVSGSTGGLVITGANTFHDLRFSDTSNARTLTLPAATTTTIAGSFLVNGTAGKLMSVISSSNGSAATLTRGSGTISCDYLSLKDSAATGGAMWYAGDNSTDVSGNSGWIFSRPASSGAGDGTYLLLVKAGT